ncbi:succinylglutamate-semialdehyde dehydrogenase [Sphingobium subterraneum]|uniref:Succinylglutamic semialdehyde dehydrogenase n=1 Tax=Sphingobium subterraneum TaxID=627688 RepID=A0A841IWG5_9SPHN|nr:succinylglutamate-semialdehyde dehydrogenase [Sphingobium subterraneum]MBB6122610.1 succinylglutamic semialdehyde dehydrogenase [Sphingobium subterraneum]
MSPPLLSHEPATGALLWQGEVGDVDAEVERAASAWGHWAARPITFRMETLRRYANGLLASEEALADLIAREVGKPLWEARAEVELAAMQVERAIAAYSERTGMRRLEGALGGRNALRHKPHGVLAVISPFSNPLSIPNGHIVPALIAGNGVVLKPSEKAPATAAMLVDLMHGAGVPKDLLRMLAGGPNVGQSLATHPGVHGVIFTGSARNGIEINRTLAGQPGTLVALEMGGNNAIVVWDTPDLATAAILVVQSAFACAGQLCTAARRLIVRDSLAAQLLAEILKLVDRLAIDHPHADPAPFMGPVIDTQVADGLTESFLYLMSRGGRPLRHMGRPKDDLPYLSPAIIDVTNVDERPDIELFGPLLQVIQVADFDAAIAEAAATHFGLSAALVGGSPEQFDRFWSSLSAGIINWNRTTHAVSPGAPVGGVGVSGNRRPGGSYSADRMAYPVASSESEQLRASIGIGLMPVDTRPMGD